MDGTLPARRALAGLSLALSLAIVPPGCSTFQGTTAASFLHKIRDDPDPNVRYQAYHNLASPRCYENDQQKAEAVRILIEKLEAGKEPIATRAVICRTLGELRDPAARPTLIKAVSDPEGGVRVQACRALGKVGTPEDAVLLSRIMTVDTLEDCRIAAIEGIGELKTRDPRILDVLLTGMDHDDPAFRLASVQALRKLTGQDHGVDLAAWQKALGPLIRPETKPTQTATAAPTPTRR